VYDTRRYVAYKVRAQCDSKREEAAENGKKIFYLQGVKLKTAGS
jgi:hypothetical protein